MDTMEQPEEVKKYAVEYWRRCIKLLEAELQSEADREVADVLRN
jgi:hypothetical protein